MSRAKEQSFESWKSELRSIGGAEIASTDHDVVGARSMVGGFWMIDANRKASIYLRNGLVMSSITVTPNVYLSNGARYRFSPVTIESSGTAVISINDGLSEQGISPWAILSGYVELEYVWAWDPLCATVTSTDPVHSGEWRRTRYGNAISFNFRPRQYSDAACRNPGKR